MAFSFPLLADCAERARAAFAAALDGLDAWLVPNNIGPTAKVIGEGEYNLWGRVATIEKRRFAWSSDLTGLLEHGREWDITPLPATAAGGSVVMTTDGAVAVDDGAILQRTDGATYRVVGAVALQAAGGITLGVVAVEAGIAGACRPGQPLTAVTGVTGSGTAAFRAAAITGGSDGEGVEAFRARILFRKRNPPAAGAPADYVRWCSAVPGVAGVRGVFVEPCWQGPGTVRVMILGDGSTGSAVPAPSVVAAAAAALPQQYPAKAGVTLVAPVEAPIDVVISGLTPDTPAVREAILAELRDLFGIRRARAAGDAAPIAGMPYLATPVTFSRSWVAQAVSAAAGEDSHVLVAPAADVAIPSGGLATLGNVQFV